MLSRVKGDGVELYLSNRFFNPRKTAWGRILFHDSAKVKIENKGRTQRMIIEEAK